MHLRFTEERHSKDSHKGQKKRYFIKGRAFSEKEQELENDRRLEKLIIIIVLTFTELYCNISRFSTDCLIQYA